MSRLRWKICKILGVLPNDPVFERLSFVQLKWIQDQIIQDEKEKLWFHLDISDYLAQFWNSEAVKKVRDERIARIAVEEDEQSTEIFEQQIHELFGRNPKE